MEETTTGNETRKHGAAQRPMLVLVTGVQGVGKTTFAELLARRIDAAIVGSDVLQIEVGGVVLKEGMLDYYNEVGREHMDALYDAVLRRAAAHLSAGRSVICDASFERRRDRAHAHETAQASGAAFLAVECLCWETVRYHRLRRRLEADGREDVVDETWRVYVDHARRFEEYDDEVPPESHLVIETSLRLEDWVEYVGDRVDLLRGAPEEEVAELAARAARKPRILIVDDDPEFLDVLEAILVEDGFDVARADGAKTAETKFDAGEFDLVVTDQRMPGGSGVELAKHVKEKSPDTPVIMVSAFGSALKPVEEQGIFRFLKKPVRLPALIGAVEQALEERDESREKP